VTENSKFLQSFIIFGEPASKANSRRLVLFGKKPAFIKSKKAITYLQGFTLQCPMNQVLFEEDLLVHMDIYYQSRRPDLDESVVLDAMQGKIYKNDRQVKAKHIYWHLDKDNPRSEIKIYSL
jgi:Holliday junction resolvase RusA-like endonuclease|tara:strand:- start:686 stop:1051 length:366 start_codon:yes stop_codon:yes gene_type:complete